MTVTFTQVGNYNPAGLCALCPDAKPTETVDVCTPTDFLPPGVSLCVQHLLSFVRLQHRNGGPEPGRSTKGRSKSARAAEPQAIPVASVVETPAQQLVPPTRAAIAQAALPQPNPATK